MAKTDLKQLDGERWRFRAEVGDFDTVQAYAGPQRVVTIVDVRIVDSGDLDRLTEVLFKQLTLVCGKWSSMLQKSDTFMFDAKVNLKKKHRLERITKVLILDKKELLKSDARVSQLVEKATAYGYKYWRRNIVDNDVIHLLKEINREAQDYYSWTENHRKSLELIAFKLLFDEWDSELSDILSRFHEFVVWVKKNVYPHIENFDPRIKKEFLRILTETWFFRFQGE